MIISHSKQVNFWKIPRTGSTTVELLLRLLADLDYSQDVVCAGHFFPLQHHNIPPTLLPSISGQPPFTRTHATPTEAIAEGVLTQAQYDSYQNFIMVRDPTARMVSAHALGFYSADWNVPDIIRDRVTPNTHFSMFKPQTDWLTEGNINIMPFSDYNNSIATIMAAFGAPMPEDIPNITRRHPAWENHTTSIATPADRAAINAFYAGDAALNT